MAVGVGDGGGATWEGTVERCRALGNSHNVASTLEIDGWIDRHTERRRQMAAGRGGVCVCARGSAIACVCACAHVRARVRMRE
jgi:hypothetical protein